MKDPRFIMAAILIVGLGAFFLLTRTAADGQVLFYTVGEYYQEASLHSRTVRLRGKPVKGSTERAADGTAVSFNMAEGDASLRIHYAGVIPDAYQEGLEVAVEGRMDGKGVFQARELIVKCPSKYEMDQGEGGENYANPGATDPQSTPMGPVPPTKKSAETGKAA